MKNLKRESLLLSHAQNALDEIKEEPTKVALEKQLEQAEQDSQQYQVDRVSQKNVLYLLTLSRALYSYFYVSIELTKLFSWFFIYRLIIFI